MRVITRIIRFVKSLKASIKQSKPFKSLQEELLLTLVRTAADIEHQMAQDFRPFGLTTAQYNVLRILRGAGSDGLCRHEIGDRMVRQVPDVTRLLDRMEEAGLILRERGSVDRRYVSTRLTPQGLTLVNKLDAEISEMQERKVGHMNEKQMRTLLTLLEELREGAESD